MKIAYLDCFSGISGDMCLGALIDAGVSVKKLVSELKKLPIKGYEVQAQKVRRASISATKVDIKLKAKGKETRANSKEHGAKRVEDIENIIYRSSLSEEIKDKGFKVFRRLFKTEAKVHGERFDRVHLHELSAVDCLVDVFGAIIGFDILKVEKIYSSPLNLGSGFIKTAHGTLPVPAPASVEILKGVPVYSTDTGFELTTPTGAALVKELSSAFGNLPLTDIERTGYGAGNKNFKDRPNVLRLFIGNLREVLEGLPSQMVMVIEANIDDMNPQIYGYVMEKLFEKGALDVFLTHIIMKKGRPGIKLTVLCRETEKEELIKIILRETTTIGLRFYKVNRRVLKREIKVVDTEFGKTKVKFARLGDEILKATPEYEDCRRIARRLNIPLVEVMKRIRIR